MSQDKEEFNNAINYFQNIIYSNIKTYSACKIGVTFIGIKTNISGSLKLHIYIIIFPFIKNESIVPYSTNLSNIYLKDLILNVDESFYKWLYDEMNKHESSK